MYCQWQWLTDDDFIRSTMHVVIVATPKYNCVFIWIYSITVDRRTADMRDNYFKNGRMKSERNQTEIPLQERKKGPLCIHTKLFSNCTTKAIFFPRVFTHFTFWRLVGWWWWWWWRCTVGIFLVECFSTHKLCLQRFVINHSTFWVVSFSSNSGNIGTYLS